MHWQTLIEHQLSHAVKDPTTQAKPYRTASPARDDADGWTTWTGFVYGRDVIPLRSGANKNSFASPIGILSKTRFLTAGLAHLKGRRGRTVCHQAI
jgi:hypothetical protein